MGCTDQIQEEHLFVTQSWQISQSTDVIQLQYLVPLEFVYLDQHNDSYGKIWNDHHHQFSQIIAKSGVKRVP